MAYVVMKYIKFAPHSVPDLPKKVALAIQWLRDLPAPPPDRVRIGPLGDGRVRHTLFKNYKALIHNLVLIPTLLLRPGPDLAPVSLSHERLVFTQSDMHESNFNVDTEGRTCLLDFGEVRLLPESFASYTMSLRSPFTAAVAQHLGWPSSSNLL